MNFNIFEKKALIGSIVVLVSFVVSIAIIGKKNLWFDAKNTYKTVIQDADGLYEGSLVTMSGLRIGEVSSLKVVEDNRVEVSFTVVQSLASKLREDSIARLYRAFVIGDKRIDLVPGTQNKAIIKPDGIIKGKDSVEIPDLISGKNMSDIFGKFETALSGIEKWRQALEALTERMNPQELAETYGLIRPTLVNVSQLADDLRVLKPFVLGLDKSLLKNNLLGKTLSHTETILRPVSKREKLLEEVLDHVASLSKEMANNPGFSGEIIKSLKEVTLTLRAIQRTWILKGHVEDVKKEGKTKKE